MYDTIDKPYEGHMMGEWAATTLPERDARGGGRRRVAPPLALARPIAFSSFLPIRYPPLTSRSALDRAFIVARPMTRIPRSSSPSLSEPDSSSEGDSPRTRNPRNALVNPPAWR